LLPVFIRALEKASQLSLASLSASTLGVIWNKQPPDVPLSRASPPRSPIPLLVIETRKPRDTEGYTAELFFRQTFLCFIFFGNAKVFSLVTKNGETPLV
jgi:hypothetical protein